MPAHERFYKGTQWNVAAGPTHLMGKKVTVTGEVYEDENELWVEVTDNGEDRFDVSLSWLS